jgi:hypothetical protein
MGTHREISGEHALRIVLIVAAFFAIGSVGFFLAVLLGYGQQGMANAPQPVSAQAKEAAMQSLSTSEQAGGVNATSTPVPANVANGRTSGNGSASASGNVPPAQADTTDQSAAAKLQVLENLNAQ